MANVFYYYSVMVSARDGDGSVREAMQNLVRHVLESKYSMKKYRNKGDSKKHKEKKRKDIEGLEKTGIKSVSRFTIFQKCLAKLRLI